MDVFGQGLAINQYIVKEDDDKFAEVRLQKNVHGGLECGWGVA